MCINVCVVLKAPDRSNSISRTSFLNKQENEIGLAEKATMRTILTPKRHLSQVKVFLLL